LESSVEKDMLTKLVGYYENFVDHTEDARQLSERDRDYYDGKQWTDEEIEILQNRGQPAIVVNRIKPKVDFLLGVERQQRTMPKAFPRTPKHEKDAESVSDSLKYITDNCDFDIKRSDVFENLSIEGYGAALVRAVLKNGKPEVDIKRIPWDRFFYDPHASERDFSDARFMGMVLWMDEDELLESYPNKKDIVDAAYLKGGDDDDDTFSDKPKYNWADKSRKRVRICEIYYKHQGTWMQCRFTKAGFITDPRPSIFLDEDGKPDCAIVATSCHIDRDNNRYGIVRQLIDLQDEINKRRSKAIHLFSTRQVFAEKGAFKDPRRARKEFSKPDGFIEFEKGKEWKVSDTSDMATSQFSLYQEGKGEIDAIGANNAMHHKQSGRAQEISQQNDYTELAQLFDALKQWERKVYRAAWNRVRQFWDDERWIRVTDDEKNLKWVALNRQITLGDKLREEGQLFDVNDPYYQQVIAVENSVAEVDVDIIIEDAPDVVNLQSEQFEVLARLAERSPEIDIIDIIKASSLRNKDQIIENIESRRKQQVQPPPPEVIQLQQRKQMAEISKDEAQASKYQAEADQTHIENQAVTTGYAPPNSI